MAKFRYSAVNQSGKVVRGRIEASNRKDLDRRVARLGLSLISAEETKGLSTGGLFQKRVSRDDLAQFCFYVERLVAGGVPLLEGLADVRDSVSNAALRNAVGLLIEDVEQGNTLSAAMKRHPSIFDSVFVSLVEAGEHSGELDTVLRNLAENIKWQDDIIKKTKKVVRYPIFALGVMILATGMLLNFVVPGMVRILKSFGTELPVYTIALINTSDFLQEYILHLLGSIFVVWLVFYFSIKAIPGVDYFMDKAKIRIPIFGVVFEKLLLSRFANTFGMLYGSGVSVIEGLKISKGALGNRFMAKGLDGVIDSIVGGTSISNAFKESGLFPPLVLRMVRLGEATGGVDNAMMQVKNYYDRDANEAIENAQAAVGPIMLLFLAGLLVWVIIAVYGPLYSALGNLKT